jgi:Holliday junction resolvasome RuvABC endonuclease subunit
MKILGIDPGINECAYCIVNDKREVVGAGLIANPYKTKGRVDTLAKITEMTLALRAVLESLPDVDVTAIEATTAFANGHRNIDTIARMALASGCAFGAARTESLIFVRPQKWKSKKNKLDNHEVFMNELGSKQVDKFYKMISDVDVTKQHNVLDALGIALWALDNCS